ncbi:acyltransferase family protein [Rhodoferax sp.]|uniref:acyltransferase family protein n=1 Tax=Rhodoferax sp. TaxID=50421 RepID=UPI0026317B9C|nr:acyltransferase family protein [Rhodoferax sp.]MDD2808228.1 hypothetical protein [Rhodoferax sp.]MDD4941979.1 hypothetical protein [Rhodoferax sp.]MDD5480347.1 hypothetical protein [Rhodoferax sp.]
MNKIRGLDSIRALAALWVFLSHLGKPPLPDYFLAFGNTTFINLTQSALGVLFNGVTAVMVFFVISGVCIR